MRHDNLWKWLFTIGCVFFVLLEVVPGRFPNTDEVFFKSPGRHWAATGHFAAPEIVGRVEVNPSLDKIFFAQPPLYSFIFGVYTKVLGFGPHLCILFDALIHVLLAALTVSVVRRVFSVPAKYAYMIGTLVLVLGTYGRPDEMGMCFAIAGMLSETLEIRPERRAALSGAMFGFCCATSLGAFLFMAPMSLAIAHQRRVLNARTAIRWTITGAVVGLLCIAPILLQYPHAYRQILAHASDQSPQLRYALVGTGLWKAVLISYFNGMIFATRFGRPMVALVAGSLAIIALCFRNVPRESARAYTTKLVVAAAGLLTLYLILPGKYTYFWFFGPWLMGLSAEMLVRCYAGLRSSARGAVVAILVICISTATEPYLKERVVLISLPRNQSFDTNMSGVRTLIPAGSRVVTSEYWWALADRCQVLDPVFSHPTTIDVDYMIKTGNGTGHPGVAHAFALYYETFAQDNHFAVLEDNLNRLPLKIGPVRLTNSAYGFGPLVLGRSTGRTVDEVQHVSGAIGTH